MAKQLIRDNQSTKLMSIFGSILKEGREDVLRQKFVDSGKLTEEEFTKLLEIDPTRSKEYSTWLCVTFIKEKPDMNKRQIDMFLGEDAYKMKADLEVYHRLKAKFTNRDIGQYKTFKDFTNNAIAVQDQLSPEEKNSGKTKTEKWGEFVLGEVEGFVCYEIPKGRTDLYEMSRELGSGTRWCTAADSADGQKYFKQYVTSDSLFIFIKGKEKYQFHYESNSFMDKDDNSVI